MRDYCDTVFSDSSMSNTKPGGILKLAEIIPDPEEHSCREPVYTIGEEQTKLRICKCKHELIIIISGQ